MMQRFFKDVRGEVGGLQDIAGAESPRAEGEDGGDEDDNDV